MENDATLSLAWYVVFLFSVTLHEAAHAWYAYRNGDPTAFYGGQVSLNPLPHIQREPFGMVIIPLLTLMFVGFPFGFASAPYNPSWASKYPKKAAWMALAGPLSNLLVVVVCLVVIYIGLSASFLTGPYESRLFFALVSGSGSQLSLNVSVIVSMLLFENLLLFILNMIPLPPLDGFSTLPLVVKRQSYNRYADFFDQPMMRTFSLIIACFVIMPKLFEPAFYFIRDDLIFRMIYF